LPTSAPGIFAGVLIGLLSTEVFIAISRLKALHISLGENVPPAVSKSFTALIPTILTLCYLPYWPQCWQR
jgi:PTS system cellobiose-specific IIC component